MRYLILLLFLPFFSTGQSYPWLTNYDASTSIEARIPAPVGYSRAPVARGSFEEWLRALPLKEAGTAVLLWDGTEKWRQDHHVGVVDLGFIGKNLQQCIDVILRMRAEYLWSKNTTDQLAFSYTCCREKVGWKKWKGGARTKIVKKNGLDDYVWVQSRSVDGSRKNFESYLYSIMNYAGTISLSNDMKTIDACQVQIGDAFIQGGVPGAGHGVLIVDMAVSPTGEMLMLLAQSYNPAENLNILVNPNDPDLSPWYPVYFEKELKTPEWTFGKEHARRF